MQFIEKNENVERVYSVCYDEEKLKGLLDEIVRNASYKIDGEFTAPSNATYKDNEFISGANLPNGDFIYENIEKIYRYTSSGELSYRDDSIAVIGTLVVAPQLAYIIGDLLSDEPNSIYKLLQYENNNELIDINEKISNANDVVNKIDNFNFKEKFNALEILKGLCEDKNQKKYFNTVLLKKYYFQALSLISLDLVSEKIIKNDVRVLLKDYKKTN